MGRPRNSPDDPALEVFTVRLPAELVRALRARADREGRPASVLVREFIVDGLEECRKKPNPTRVRAREGPELARDAVLAALEAHAAASTSGLVDLVVLVRALEARGFQRDEVHAELVALSRAGGWELRPESAVGAALEDAALCPRIQDGPPLAWARART